MTMEPPAEGCQFDGLDLLARQLPGQVKENLPPGAVHFVNEAVKPSFVRSLVCRQGFRKQRQGPPSVFRIVEQPIERDLERCGHLLKSLQLRNRVAIFKAGDMEAEQARAFFEVGLGEVPLLPEQAKPVSDIHYQFSVDDGSLLTGGQYADGEPLSSSPLDRLIRVGTTVTVSLWKAPEECRFLRHAPTGQLFILSVRLRG